MNHHEDDVGTHNHEHIDAPLGVTATPQPGDEAHAGDRAESAHELAAFAAVLADHTVAGVRRWPDAPATIALEAVALRADWTCVTLDGAEDTSATEFLDTCAEAFELPDWFGYNFDALEECLADLEPGDFSGRLVLWTDWAPFAEAAPEEFATALDVLRASTRSWRSEPGFGALVLLVGPGPNVAVPQLTLA